MKSLFALIFLIVSLNSPAQSIAQILESTKGQTVTLKSGDVVLPKATADSTRLYVQKLQRDYFEEVGRSRECEFKLGLLQFSHNNRSVSYQGLQAQYATMKLQYDRCQKAKKRRFWIGLGVGFVGSTLSYIAIQN